MKFSFSSFLVGLIVFILGILSLLAPFIVPQAREQDFANTSYPLMVSLVLILCLLLIIFETQSSLIDGKMVAFLGVLVAINAGLRFLENAIPGPAGFSPTFFLIIITGYFFGSRIGFLMGAMTMFVSGLITGGIGPWLPGQMITAGWVGQSSTLLKVGVSKLNLKGKPSETIILAIFGAFWGMLYGWIINLWFWPFFGASAGQTYLQTASFIENLSRYTAYYLATSLIWDMTRSFGNVLIILFFAKPVLKIFKRFKNRFSFSFIETGEG